MQGADLHIHTTASDGRWTVLEILQAAVRKNLSAIAITDHDTVDGYHEIAKLQHSFSGLIIPGIEFNTETDVLEVHILGYYVDTMHPTFQHVLADLRDARIKRVRLMVEKLTNLGYDLNFKEIIAKAGSSKSLGRPHVAAAMVEKGYVSTVGEAFSGLIAKGGPAYVPHHKLSPVEAIETVLAARGIPVLAHPGLVGDDNYIKSLISKGLMGLEAFHPTHDKATTNHYVQIAHNHNLIVTGGSDFHAIPGRYPEDLGEFTIPFELVKILNEHQKLRI
jgi:predicted metal-dependent phosphoesterase TrpH